MISVGSLLTNGLCRLNEMVNWNVILPLLIFYPTSRCNSRCISCDWWRRTGADDLTLLEIEGLAECLPSLGTRVVLLSGGEPLLRKDLFDIAALFRAEGMDLWLLTSGLCLEKHAEEVAKMFSRVTVSLDASDAALYRHIRGVDGLQALEAGVARLRALAPDLAISARATLHRGNYAEVSSLVDKARSMALNGISFLAADVSSLAFGRNQPLEAEARDALLLSLNEVAEFERVIAEAVASHRDAFKSGFVAESPAKLRRLTQYYGALLGDGEFPPVMCNAPWVSVVVETDGAVRPCFFHRSVGSVREKPLSEIIQKDLRSFRRGLDIFTNPVCQRCTCSLRVGLLSNIW